MRKYYDNKIFKINGELTAICETQDTNYGFRHLATLHKNGYEIAKAKCCYYNRTWESYKYQSVLKGLLDKTDLLTEKEKDEFIENARIENSKELDRQFGTLGAIMKMGEIFADTQKEKNDWKARMLKAGLEGKGLIMPDDWDTLTEDDKEARLNGVIGQFAGTA